MTRAGDTQAAGHGGEKWCAEVCVNGRSLRADAQTTGACPRGINVKPGQDKKSGSHFVGTLNLKVHFSNATLTDAASPVLFFSEAHDTLIQCKVSPNC